MLKTLTLTTALVMGATAAFASDIAIGVGQPDRGYEAFGKAMANSLSKAHNVTVVNYEGSDDISKAVCDGDVQVGIMQIDAIHARAKEGCTMRTIGNYGQEFAYLMVPPNSDIGDLHDLDGSSKILVDTEGSGTFLFWETIVGIENGPDGNKSTWSEAVPVADFSFLASTLAASSEIDAALFVTTTGSPELKELLAEGWELAKMSDKDINDQLHNGEVLYPRETAEIEGTGGWFSGDESAKSYVVRSFVTLSRDTSLDRRAFQDIARAAKRAEAAK